MDDEAKLIWVKIMAVIITMSAAFLLFGCSTIPEAPRTYKIYPTQIVIIDKDVNLDTLKKLGGIIQNIPITNTIDMEKETSSEGGDASVPISVTR